LEKRKSRPQGIRTAHFYFHRSARFGRKIKGEKDAEQYLFGSFLV
jgi:hypothetical protein